MHKKIGRGRDSNPPRDTSVEKIEKKSYNAEQKLKAGPLVSPGNVCYPEKKEKHFWFSSLGQQVQFKNLQNL